MGTKPPEEEGFDAPTLVRMMSETGRLVGTVLGNQYQIQEVIGEGGIGVVYRARQISVDREVAIKVLRKQYANDDLAVRRFENEATAISRLRHPNTLRLYDCQRTPQGDLYIVTELLSGCPLSDVLRQEGRLSIERAVRTLDEVCRSLSEAHAAGIVHRDLKPANIFLDRVGNEDVIKVLDFGIAKILQGSGGLTRAGAVPGTPHYMSPEHAAAQRVDHRADIYSLGVILYQMIAGKPPFDASTVMDILKAHITDPAPSFKVTAPDLSVPSELERVVMWMLEKAPEDRPQSVDEARAQFPAILALRAPKPRARNPSGPRVSSSDLSPSGSAETLRPDDPWLTGPPLLPEIAFPDRTDPQKPDAPLGEAPIVDARIEETDTKAVRVALSSTPSAPSAAASYAVEKQRWRLYTLIAGFGGIALGILIRVASEPPKSLLIETVRSEVASAQHVPSAEASTPAPPIVAKLEEPVAHTSTSGAAHAMLESDPAGAAVIGPDGKQIGKTPLDVILTEPKTYVLIDGKRANKVLLDPERDAGRTLHVVLEDTSAFDPDTDASPPRKHKPVHHADKSKAARKPHH